MRSRGDVPRVALVRLRQDRGGYARIVRRTFEVQLEGSGIADPAVPPIAAIVHDIDVEDVKFARAEALFDLLHAWYRTRAGDR